MKSAAPREEAAATSAPLAATYPGAPPRTPPREEAAAKSASPSSSLAAQLRRRARSDLAEANRSGRLGPALAKAVGPQQPVAPQRPVANVQEPLAKSGPPEQEASMKSAPTLRARTPPAAQALPSSPLAALRQRARGTLAEASRSGRLGPALTKAAPPQPGGEPEEAAARSAPPDPSAPPPLAPPKPLSKPGPKEEEPEQAKCVFSWAGAAVNSAFGGGDETAESDLRDPLPEPNKAPAEAAAAGAGQRELPLAPPEDIEQDQLAPREYIKHEEGQDVPGEGQSSGVPDQTYSAASAAESDLRHPLPEPVEAPSEYRASLQELERIDMHSAFHREVPLAPPEDLEKDQVAPREHINHEEGQDMPGEDRFKEHAQPPTDGKETTARQAHAQAHADWAESLAAPHQTYSAASASESDLRHPLPEPVGAPSEHRASGSREVPLAPPEDIEKDQVAPREHIKHEDGQDMPGEATLRKQAADDWPHPRPTKKFADGFNSTLGFPGEGPTTAVENDLRHPLPEPVEAPSEYRASLQELERRDMHSAFHREVPLAPPEDIEKDQVAPREHVKHEEGQDMPGEDRRSDPTQATADWAQSTAASYSDLREPLPEPVQSPSEHHGFHQEVPLAPPETAEEDQLAPVDYIKNEDGQDVPVEDRRSANAQAHADWAESLAAPHQGVPGEDRRSANAQAHADWAQSLAAPHPEPVKTLSEQHGFQHASRQEDHAAPKEGVFAGPDAGRQPLGGSLVYSNGKWVKRSEPESAPSSPSGGLVYRNGKFVRLGDTASQPAASVGRTQAHAETEALLDRIRAEALGTPPLAPSEEYRRPQAFHAQHPDYLAVPLAPPEDREEDQLAPREGLGAGDQAAPVEKAALDHTIPYSSKLNSL